MLRNDRELALDRVTEICKLAADHYEEAAEMIHDIDLSRTFRQAARNRSRLLNEMEEAIRQAGVLPSEPDRDREAFDHLLTRVKAAVKRDETEVLLEKSARIEEESKKRVDDAIAIRFAGRIPEVLGKISSEIDRSHERLTEVKKKKT